MQADRAVRGDPLLKSAQAGRVRGSSRSGAGGRRSPAQQDLALSAFEALRAEGRAPALQIQRVARARDFERIVFSDGMAAVVAPLGLLGRIRFKNHRRGPGPRLDAVRRSIRARGYVGDAPVIARVGRKGRWVVVDGGHRLTAALERAGSFWSRLFGAPDDDVYFLLFQGPRSGARSPVKGRARKSSGARSHSR